MIVTADQIRQAARTLGLSGRSLCIHSSLRSFGRVEGGAPALVAALLAEGCTVLVPTFSWSFAVPPTRRLPRNGWDYDAFPGPTSGLDRVYTPDATEIDADMGAVPAAVLVLPGRARGDHPLCSFTAVGSRAAVLTAGQQALDVFAPLEALAECDGAVVLMGVGLDRMTLLHRAEEAAGRRPFRRWANGPDGRPMEVAVGGCSDGFLKLEPLLAPFMQVARVGQSLWRAFPPAATIAVAARAMRHDPGITYCDAPGCERCRDAVLGGPSG